MVGIPVGIFVILAVSVAGFTTSNLPIVPETDSPLLLPWLLLSTVGWLRVRCLLADGIEIKQ